ncbi:hypothetical protein TruAng_012165 [Truncatella angustata]|nr:hypothetical protein TruAng_012165 [Truncatella angustata]
MAVMELAREEDKWIRKLGEALWIRERCDGCDSNRPCSDQCPGSRYEKLARYVQFCKAVVDPEHDESTLRAFLRDEAKLLEIVRVLRSNPDITREELERVVKHMIVGTVTIIPPTVLVGHAVKIMTMLDSAPALQTSPQRLENAEARVPWSPKSTFSEFVEQAFPTTKHSILSDHTHSDFNEFIGDLSAVNIRNALKVSIRGTSILQDHLKLDRRSNVLEIYHHTAFIKEQLRQTKDAKDLTVAQSLKR